MVVIEGVHRGHYVVGALGTGCCVAVPIAAQARLAGIHIGDDDIDALDEMELALPVTVGGVRDVEIAGFISKIKKVGKKVGKAVKKGAKKVSKVAKKAVNVAKKVAKSKAVKTLYTAAKQAAPSPYKEYISAAEFAGRVGSAIAKGSKKAKKAKTIASKLAKGTVSLSQAQKAAKKAKIKPQTITATAALFKGVASKNPAALSALNAAKKIEALKVVPKPPKKKANKSKTKTTTPPAAMPGGKTYTVPGPSGRKYQVVVQAA